MFYFNPKLTLKYLCSMTVVCCKRVFSKRPIYFLVELGRKVIYSAERHFIR